MEYADAFLLNSEKRNERPVVVTAKRNTVGDVIEHPDLPKRCVVVMTTMTGGSGSGAYDVWPDCYCLYLVSHDDFLVSLAGNYAEPPEIHQRFQDCTYRRSFPYCQPILFEPLIPTVILYLILPRA